MTGEPNEWTRRPQTIELWARRVRRTWCLLFLQWPELLAILILRGGDGRDSVPPATRRWSRLRDEGAAGEAGDLGGWTIAIAGEGRAGTLPSARGGGGDPAISNEDGAAVEGAAGEGGVTDCSTAAMAGGGCGGTVSAGSPTTRNGADAPLGAVPGASSTVRSILPSPLFTK